MHGIFNILLANWLFLIVWNRQGFMLEICENGENAVREILGLKMVEKMNSSGDGQIEQYIYGWEYD